jgi:hypothetical protein
MDFKPSVDRLFRQAKFNNLKGQICENPITKSKWVPGADPVPLQKRAACRALVARAWFAYWNPGLPPLPLCPGERWNLKIKGGINYLVSEYAASLEFREYDTFRHPSFELYVRGVMALPSRSDFIGQHPELLKRYPPLPLPGLRHGLNWDPPKRDRRHRCRRRRSRGSQR